MAPKLKVVNYAFTSKVDDAEAGVLKAKDKMLQLSGITGFIDDGNMANYAHHVRAMLAIHQHVRDNIAKCICHTGFGMNLSCPVHSSHKERST